MKSLLVIIAMCASFPVAAQSVKLPPTVSTMINPQRTASDDMEINGLIGRALLVNRECNVAIDNIPPHTSVFLIQRRVANLIMIQNDRNKDVNDTVKMLNTPVITYITRAVNDVFGC
jgi:hypothetical protein